MASAPVPRRGISCYTFINETEAFLYRNSTFSLMVASSMLSSFSATLSRSLLSAPARRAIIRAGKGVYYKMWVYDSPIGPLYIVRTDDGQYGFLYNGIIWEACPTPQIEADNVYCRATGCAAASDLEELPHDLSEWTYVPR